MHRSCRRESGTAEFARRLSEEKGSSSHRELFADHVLRDPCGSPGGQGREPGVFGDGVLPAGHSGSRNHRHLRLQQSGLLRLVPGDKAASAGEAPPRILLAGPGVSQRRAVHPDLLQCDDDPRGMEARESRNGAQSPVMRSGTVPNLSPHSRGRRPCSSRVTSRASRVAGNSCPMTASNVARLRATECSGTMSPYPVVVSVARLKYSRRPR